MDVTTFSRQDGTARDRDLETIIGIISDTWKATTECEVISIDDTFYQLGGNSIVIMKVFTKLKNNFFPDLKLLDFFTYPTIQKLGAYLFSVT